MTTLRSDLAAHRSASPPLVLLALEPLSPWKSKGWDELVPPATLTEARERRDELARLLLQERAVAADFLLALADFDRRRGWERLGHASLFAFLSRELGLSNGAAWTRSSAARLLPRFPAVEAALRDGRLCLSSVGELARVLSADNEADVLPRFFGRSFREAKELVAAILPNPKPPGRDVVARLAPAATVNPRPSMALAIESARPSEGTPRSAATPAKVPDLPVSVLLSPSPDALSMQDPTARSLRAHEAGATHPARVRTDEIEPLDAQLRRLSTTVSARFIEKLTRARAGLSHVSPRATTEQVLEAALDLLLEKQARRKALVQAPRAGRRERSPSPTPSPASRTSTSAEPPASRRIPAAIAREVRQRDSDRCQFPLDAGGVCGSTWQVELDHLVPLAQGGATTVANLRCACAPHNRYAARLALGAAAAGARRPRHAPAPAGEADGAHGGDARTRSCFGTSGG